MAAHPVSPQAVSDPVRPADEPLSRWGRPLAVATAAVFCLSAAFPVVAGLSKDTASFPSWWGPVDVGIAFLLAALAIAVLSLAHGRTDEETEVASYRAYRVLIHGIFAMLALFALFGDRIVWVNCLTGLAWRYWLLLYGLPGWLAAMGAARSPSPVSTRRRR